MRRIFTTFLALTFTFLLMGRLEAAELLDKIVAVVNDDIVTQSELDRNLAPIFQEYKNRYQGEIFIEKMTKARAQILNQMIEDKLVLQEAKAKKVPVSEEELNRKLADFKRRFRTEKDFDLFLDSQGMTLTKLKDHYRDMIAIQKIQSAEVRSRVIVSPLEAKRYYDEHVKDFTSPESFHVLTITIRKHTQDDKTKTQAVDPQQKLESLRSSVLHGTLSFSEAAQKNSEDTHAEEGGDMGFMSKGQFIPQLEEAIFKLKPGEVTPVLETEIGYHIFQLVEVQPEHTKSFDESRDQIENIIYSEKSRKRFEDWVAQLRKNAYISIR